MSFDSTPLPRRVKNLTGQQFGRLTVISFSHIDKHRCAHWNCICDCGNACCVGAQPLQRGTTVSCGCRSKECLAARRWKHGYARHELYQTYCAMLARCYDPSHEAYARYGGRGITVCERWRESFADFLADIGARPSPKHSLDRINNDLGYRPDNIRWATASQQMNNTKLNHLLTYNGQTMTMTQWAQYLNISKYVIYQRIHNGWSVDRTLTTPVRPRRPNRRTA